MHHFKSNLPGRVIRNRRGITPLNSIIVSLDFLLQSMDNLFWQNVKHPLIGRVWWQQARQITHAYALSTLALGFVQIISPASMCICDKAKQCFGQAFTFVSRNVPSWVLNIEKMKKPSQGSCLSFCGWQWYLNVKYDSNNPLIVCEFTLCVI